jgi:hypothetical protein
MQKTLQSLLLVLPPAGHFQHPDVELLTLHIQPLLHFSKTSQFFLGCYDMCKNDLQTGGDILCSKGRHCSCASASYELWQDFL